jgi:hypothetical protein
MASEVLMTISKDEAERARLMSEFTGQTHLDFSASKFPLK